MKQFLIFTMLLFSFAAFGQKITSADEVIVKDSMRISGDWISAITTDTAFWAAAGSEIPTTEAVKLYVQKSLGAAGAVLSVFGRTGAITASPGDYTAAQITATAHGGISGVTTQAQLEELETEKLSTAAGAVGSANIATGAVGPDELASTAVSAGTYGSATDIPVFTVDADGRVTGVTNVASASGTDDQTAAEVPFSPTGGIAATDVQAMGAELDTEKLNTSGLLAAMLAVDGAGSDLDADLLDGQHGAYYLDLDNATNQIATAQIEDDAVTLAKQAAGTSNRVMGYDAAGNPAEISAGTNVTISAGVISASGGGTPGGSDTQVQYNSAGSFSGDAGLTYDATNGILKSGRIYIDEAATISPGTDRVRIFTSPTNAGKAALSFYGSTSLNNIANKNVGKIDFLSRDGDANGVVVSRIQSYATEVHSAGNNAAAILFQTIPVDSTELETVLLIEGNGDTRINRNLNLQGRFLGEMSLQETTSVENSPGILKITGIGSVNSLGLSHIGSVDFYSDDDATAGDGIGVRVASVEAVAENTHSSGANPTGIRFLVNSGASLNEAGRFDKDSNFAVNGNIKFTPTSATLTRLWGDTGDGVGKFQTLTGGLMDGTGAAERVPYFSAANTLASSANFAFSSNRLTLLNAAGASFRFGYSGSQYADMVGTSSGDASINPTSFEFGINTTSPLASLHVSDPGTGDQDGLILDRTGSISDNDHNAIGFAVSGNVQARIAAEKQGVTTDLNFYVGTTGTVGSTKVLSIEGADGEVVVPVKATINDATFTGLPTINPISAALASALSPSDGALVYVNTTDATFTSVGFWGYENGAWVKL